MPEKEAEFCIPFNPPVTCDAVFIEDRLNLGAEIDLFPPTTAPNKA
jgi:hypothetical protein